MDTDSDFAVTEFDTALEIPRATAPEATDVEGIEDAQITGDPSAGKKISATFNIDDPSRATAMKEGACDLTQAKIAPAVAYCAPLEPVVADRLDMNTTLAGEITDDDISRLYEYSGRLLSVSAELSYLPLLFSSSLTYFEIRNISPEASHLAKSFLATLPYESPGLQFVELHGMHQLPAVTLYPIANLKQLRLLEPSDIAQMDDFSFLARLSALPHLTTFNLISHNLSSVASLSIYAVHNIGFEQLKNLRVTGSFSLIHNIVTLVSSRELEVLQLVRVVHSEDYLLFGSERYPSEEKLRVMEQEEEELHIWRKRKVMERLSPEEGAQLSRKSNMMERKKGKKEKGKEVLQFSLNELQALLNLLLELQDLPPKSATSLLAQKINSLNRKVSAVEDELRSVEEEWRQEEREYKDRKITKKMGQLSTTNVSEAEMEAARKAIEEGPFPGMNQMKVAKAALQLLLEVLQRLEMALLELQTAENPPFKSVCSSLDSPAGASTGVSVVDKQPVTSDYAFVLPESVFLSVEHLHALELLDIERWAIVGLSSSLSRTVRRWPKMRALHLPLEHGPGVGLEVFRAIADSCPELRSLQISVDFSSLPPLSEECGAPFAFRHELNMLSVNSFSAKSHGKKDVLLVARYLNILSPHLKMELTSRTNCEQAAGLWKEVYELVQAFQLVRDDERNGD
ncbi:hypothetical protein BDQ12DRAFT_671917 [Crucibulum laeve]|uniref:Uncharacterized protein n=1 Tax=Crucibulum laeve TaxID=68775 RepID=A0A5C3LF78_9AGAR|nr:hypothetical protein BDQ12DRAFT_671917 [Crucibulum laeve]